MFNQLKIKKMKNIKLFGTLFMMAAMIGCTDLEEDPVGVLAPEGFFRSESDVEAAIFGAYGRIASERLYGRKLVLTIQLLSDMCDIGDRGTPARRQQINDFNSDANNGMTSNIWPYSYQVISACNAAIEGANIIELDDDTRNRLIAEARFVRAWMYYHLIRLYGDIPYIGEFVNDPSSVASISKTSDDDIYDYIIEDMEFAWQHLPMKHIDNVRTRPSKGTAYTMLASVYLTLGNWQQAYEKAKWVIDNADQLEYGLVDDYQDLFDATKQDGIKEHIFAVDFLGQINGGGGENDDLMGPITGVRGADKVGWSVSVPSMKVYETWDARDYRKKVSFADSMIIGGELKDYTFYEDVPRPHMAKFHRYPGNANEDTRYSDHNYVCFRYAEVLLTAAEALNEVSGPTAEAQGYVNQIRARARQWPTYTSDFPADVETNLTKDEFRDMVLEERRLELCFEFKRWYDIKRRQMGDEVFKGPNSLEPHDNFNSAYHYLLALPGDELDRNPNLQPQNPGY
jgi:hypothetical protein